MYDNKIRLSQDVLEKAEQIAAAWGLKNARAAVEAVFRKYSDDYLHGREPLKSSGTVPFLISPYPMPHNPEASHQPDCEALNELDDLLGF